MTLLYCADVHTIGIFEVVAEARAQKDSHDVRSLLFALYYILYNILHTCRLMYICAIIELVVYQVNQGGAMYLVINIANAPNFRCHI